MLRTIALCLSLAGPASAQSTWYVDLTGTPPGSGTVGDPYTSIDFALNQPSTLSGDTVLVAPGTYVENVTFPGRGVSLIATAGAGATTIDAGGSGSAVTFQGTDGTQMRMCSFRITGGTGTSPSATTDDEQGGGLLALGAIVKVLDCTIEGNTAYEGGGVYAQDSDFDMRTSTVCNNTVTGTNCAGAGLAFRGGTNVLRRTVIDSNVAGTPSVPGMGGGIHATGPLSVRRCAIKDNRADLQGGGLWGGDELAGSRVSDNVSQFGGGVYRTTTVHLTAFQRNSADSASGSGHFGGGVYGPSLVTNSYFEGNTAFGEGAAAHSATLIGCTIEMNAAYDADSEAAEGGGVAFSDLTNCVVRFNSAVGQLGAFGAGASESTLVDCQLIGNTLQNVFDAEVAYGGGAYECAVQGTLVADNSTTGYGGGVYGGTTLSTELVGNEAKWGGGACDAYLERTTVFDNSASQGAEGVHVTTFSSSTVLDSIVWQNGALEIQVAAFGSITVTYSDVLGGWTGTGNIDQDPLFWSPLAPDVHLQELSPCIDAGDPASPLDPDGSRADMGAHPYDPAYTG